MPLKVCFHSDFMESVKETKKILPIHIQVIPTNRCNLDCSFCSCKARNKQTEMSIFDYKHLLEISTQLGCKAYTITGGGEPLLHPDINEMLYETKRMSIDIGLVTNGLLLNELYPSALRRLTWCRVSASDTRDFDNDAQGVLLDALNKSEEGIDWAFSYVVSKDFNADNFIKYVKFANAHGFTHVRAVSDLIDIPNAYPMEDVRRVMVEAGINDSLMIYQDRQQYNRGRKNCLISLLKPVIGADGIVYPCCGAQYAKLEQPLDLPDYMSMGHFTNLPAIIDKQKHFDGSACEVCYYENYNILLDVLTKKIEHENFL